jgi:hypothetical protein
MNKSKEHKHTWLDCLKVIFDFAVIVVMIFAYQSANKANKISRDANKIAFTSLKNSYVPWLRITGIEASVIDANNIEIKYVCKNVANGPALNLYITVVIFGKSTTEKLYDSEALMPNSEGNYSSYVNLHGSYRPKDIIEKLKQGESPIIFDVCFEDIFGREITTVPL